MTANQLDRRQLLKGLGAGALAAGAAATLGSTAALAGGGKPAIVGSWKIVIHQGKRTTDAITNFTPDGLMFNIDAGSPSTGLGVWQNRGGGKFVFAFITYDLSKGAPGIQVHVSGKGTAVAGSVKGTFKVEVGPNDTPAGSGTFDGEPLTI
ncbi:MAG: hypothetical protein M3082_04890 [Candidatus Dormibacteraeota bacterium]|nr:hypothetical protein [Candidatus Dormibacteraeota bacterium]